MPFLQSCDGSLPVHKNLQRLYHQDLNAFHIIRGLCATPPNIISTIMLDFDLLQNIKSMVLMVASRSSKRCW